VIRVAIVVLALTLLPASFAPGQAASSGYGAKGHPQKQTHLAKRRHLVARRAAASPTAPPRAWYGADPSYGPGTPLFRQLQREGRCVMDEGYGRFTYCDRW
jgi:hypothetical protein